MAVKWYNPINWFSSAEKTELPVKQAADSIFGSYGGFVVRDIGSVAFNGEKNPGLSGPIVDYAPDHQALTARSW